MRALPIAGLVLMGCQNPDRFVPSPDGRYSVALFRPAERVYGMPKTPAFAGWAELYGPFGLSCGRGASTFNHQPSGAVRWSDTDVVVDGIDGRWTFEPCEFVANRTDDRY